MRRAGILLLSVAVSAPAHGDDPPTVDHQPIPCTIPAQPASVCAVVSDDSNVARARVYFRPAEDKFYSYVEMSFGGLNYCATLPAPRQGKLKAIDYYIQAVDDQYQAQRTSTFQMLVQPEGVCEFPPIEKDKDRAAKIKVFASSNKQGKKLPDEFDPTGVTFVPIP